MRNIGEKHNFKVAICTPEIFSLFLLYKAKNKDYEDGKDAIYTQNTYKITSVKGHYHEYSQFS